jgi:cell division protein FtsW
MATHASAPSLAGGNALVRYNRNRRSSLAIWWQEIDRVTLALVLILMAIGTVSVAAASPASARSTSSQCMCAGSCWA